MKHEPMQGLKIGEVMVGNNHPTFFIADIAANHDGDLSRAKDLIFLAAESGTNAAKFQHFTAKTIVSDFGFKSLGGQKSHQASWKKSVYNIYQDASINMDWISVLKETCDKAGIAFFTSPYSFEIVDMVDPYVCAFKIGSGDITWHEIIRYMVNKKKPILLATGAGDMRDVQSAMDVILERTRDVVLMQCNTNYTASLENFKYVSLNVLKTYATMYPGVILGLSDHTQGHAAVLGSVALGAKVIEKHFTDDKSRIGPDHAFSMDPVAWKEMVDRTRELELALGSAVKRVEQNEVETVVLQRRSIRLARELVAGTILRKDDLVVLRPCPIDGIPPYQVNEVVGRKVLRDMKEGEHIRWTDLV